MTRCTRCGRRLKAPTPSGLGPVCQLAVLGRADKPKRTEKTPVKRDERTGDLFAEVRL